MLMVFHVPDLGSQCCPWGSERVTRIIHSIVVLSHLWCEEMAPAPAQITEKSHSVKFWGFLLLIPRWKVLRNPNEWTCSKTRSVCKDLYTAGLQLRDRNYSLCICSNPSLAKCL